jgi:hypothetical protein
MHLAAIARFEPPTEQAVALGKHIPNVAQIIAQPF